MAQQPPLGPPVDPMDSSPQPAILSPAELGTMVVVMAITAAIASWLLAGAATLAYEKATAFSTPAWVMLAYGFLDQLSSIIILPAYILTGLWLLRVRRNADLIKPRQQRWGDIWVWLGWLVPFFNLVAPAQIVDDVWRTTVPSRSRKRIGAWWNTWIFSGLLAIVELVISDSARVGVGDVIVDWMSAVSVTAAAILWVSIVQAISNVQDGLARKIIEARQSVRDGKIKGVIVGVAPAIVMSILALLALYNTGAYTGKRDVADANIGECLGSDTAARSVNEITGDDLTIVPCNSPSAFWTVIDSETKTPYSSFQPNCEFTAADQIFTRTRPREKISTVLCLKSLVR